ncbi:hypothetical protein [Pseudoalteromonas denitrificans]|jgi:hypothetical protein|uniref:Uncharacterized protein n=1 Tax=Pseudoalteromonas denitrificans DSM 6059 TaxID=1123010 RepID=A0A1I1JI99_9GAMM|nr:hypothetical protein [Pseudoalteromonas denitrificans]SFC47901.1 hypothetical protein SAMN02745724_01753 [Pseudoalteromonas denitrificans DSM 6059]
MLKKTFIYVAIVTSSFTSYAELFSESYYKKLTPHFSGYLEELKEFNSNLVKSDFIACDLADQKIDPCDADKSKYLYDYATGNYGKKIKRRNGFAIDNSNLNYLENELLSAHAEYLKQTTQEARQRVAEYLENTNKAKK